MGINNRKFLFFYLNTGAGHISAAKVLTQAMKEKNPDITVELENGFSTKNIAGKIFFERFYNVACNYIHGAFSLAYDLGKFRFFQRFINRFMFFEVFYLRKIIIEKHATDIVSFHFGLTPALKKAVSKVPWKVNITTIVTDPYTVPRAWFFERDMDYLVYSEEAKEIGVKECKVPSERIKVIPFLMNPKYRTVYTKEEIRQKKIELGYDPDKKLVLLVGGGEGLPGATEILSQCIIHKSNFALAVICGKDVPKRTNFELLSKANPKRDIHVYGFINYLDELVKICDCAVIKAGPATLMEILSCRKPVIICKYIYNQELGNMHFAVRNHVGWYIRRPGEIYKKINSILNDEQFDEKMKHQFEKLQIDTDASKIADILLSK